MLKKPFMFFNLVLIMCSAIVFSGCGTVSPYDESTNFMITDSFMQEYFTCYSYSVKIPYVENISDIKITCQLLDSNGSVLFEREDTYDSNTVNEDHFDISFTGYTRLDADKGRPETVKIYVEVATSKEWLYGLIGGIAGGLALTGILIYFIIKKSKEHKCKAAVQ